MRHIKKGRLDYSDLNVPPEKHEYETAKYFVDRGLDVSFIRPSSVKGTNSPDFRMNGKIWETKSPTKYSKRSFEDNFKKAIKQSCHIVFDLRRLSIKDEIIYRRELQKWSCVHGVSSLIVITRDGRILTIRGSIDIIRL